MEIRDDLEKINELVSLQKQVKSLRVQDTLGKQNFQEDMKKVFETVAEIAKSFNDVSKDIAQTMMESSKECFKATSDLNKKVS